MREHNINPRTFHVREIPDSLDECKTTLTRGILFALDPSHQQGSVALFV